MCVIERNPKPPRLQKVSNVLTTNTNMKKLSSENLLGMHGAEDAGSVENFGAITVSFLPVAIWQAGLPWATRNFQRVLFQLRGDPCKIS